MADPTAPQLPPDAPQDVKDFFECKGDKLVWKKGKVTWLTLKLDDFEVTPDVSFEHGKNGGVQISISLPGTGISGTVDASVNADGQLVVDNVSLALKLFKGKIDDAIKSINDWFKHNKKKLKPAVYKKGAVTLEKVNTTGAYAPPVVVPDEDQEGNKPEPVSMPAGAAAVALTPGVEAWDTGVYTPAQEVVQSESSSSTSLPVLLIGAFLAVIGLGLAFGLFLFGGGGPGATPAPTLVAAVSPTPTPMPTPTPTPTPTTSPTPTPTATPTASPSPSPTPTPTPTPAAATPTPNVQESLISAVCMKIVHAALGRYISHIDYDMWFDAGLSVAFFELTVKGANKDEPVKLLYDPETGTWHGQIGLEEAGPKQFVLLTAYLPDGTTIDVTDDLIDYFRSDAFDVPYPAEPAFGDCPVE